MLKKLAVRIINWIFKTNLTEEDLDLLIAFLKMLIGLFGSKEAAMMHVRNTTRIANLQDPSKSKKLFEALEETLGEE